MSVITLQYGQCGTQVGYVFYDTLAKDLGFKFIRNSVVSFDDYYESSVERWFTLSHRNELFARSVLVDTEEKVVEEIHNKQNRLVWQYPRSNIITSPSGGAGNNWACGYAEAGPKVETDVWESVRRECEATDNVCCFINLLSAAGGTGSGISSLITEMVQDEFPRKSVINSLVLPFVHGEVTTQNYNTFMTIGKIYDCCDMHLIFENDYLKRMCCSFIRDSSQITFKDMNMLIGMQLAALFQPIQDKRNGHIPNMIAQLVPQPSLKFISLRSTPHTQGELVSPDTLIEWNILLKHLFETLCIYTHGRQMTPDWELKLPPTRIIRQNSGVKYAKCFANTIITRGQGEVNPAHLQDWRASNLYVGGSEFERFNHFHQKRKFLHYKKFAVLASNNTFFKKRLSNTSRQSWETFFKNVLVHHYYKYSVTKAELLGMLAKIETIVSSYDSLGL